MCIFKTNNETHNKLNQNSIKNLQTGENERNEVCFVLRQIHSHQQLDSKSQNFVSSKGLYASCLGSTNVRSDRGIF